MENRIRQLRQEQRMTQVRLSIELEVSQETVSAYEKGKYYPSFPMLVRLSELFHTSIDYIMGLSDVRHPQSADLPANTERILALFSVLDERQQDRVISYTEGLMTRF